MTPLLVQDVLDKFPESLCYVQGDLGQNILNICSPENPKEKSVVVINSAEKIRSAQCQMFSMVITGKDIAEKVQQEQLLPPQCALVTSTNLRMSMAEIMEAFFYEPPSPMTEEPIHPTAVIHPTALIGEDCKIDPYVVVGPNVKVGKRCHLASHSVLESNVKVGDYTHIGPFCFLGAKTQIGQCCVLYSHTNVGTQGFGYAADVESKKVKSLPHIGAVVIGDFVHLHSFTTVDRGTINDTLIKDYNKVGSMSYIAHNMRLEPFNFISGSFSGAGSSALEGECHLGGCIAIANGVSVGKRSVLSAGSGVLRNLKGNTHYIAHPLHAENCIPVSTYTKIKRKLKRLISDTDT